MSYLLLVLLKYLLSIIYYSWFIPYLLSSIVIYLFWSTWGPVSLVRFVVDKAVRGGHVLVCLVRFSSFLVN